MNYTFVCECGESCLVDRSIKQGPPSWTKCACGRRMARDWRSDRPMLDTSSCRDHDDIPPEKRVIEGVRGNTKAQALKKEKRFQEHISERRSLLADGGNRGGFRHTHSVPADLYHGKIKETGDKNYWSDKKNLERHSSCGVS